SGDMVALSKTVRQILDQGGLQEVKILASGNIEEDELHRMLSAGAMIDGFGIGTRLTTSWDFPYLECAYKLQEYDGRPTRKFSEGKVTWPGRKQVFRNYDVDGKMSGDILGLSEEAPLGKPLLTPVMRDGKRLGSKMSCKDIREYCMDEMSRLPPQLTSLKEAKYEVTISDALCQLATKIRNLS
ncbi:MAG: nicotinate phosphoribosyltransferase, partial [Limisphaerales bacterium]